MFWKVIEKGRKTEMDKALCPYHGTIESIEEKIDKINTTCCSTASIEQRVKTNILLEQLNLKMDGLNDKLRDTEETLEKYKNYFYIGVGILIAIQFFGIDKKIKLLLFGGV